VVGGADRREQIVVAAFERVAEIGFEGLRLRQVAEQVGIDHSTLHHYFATKQDLIAAVTEYTTRQFWPTGATGPDPAAALRQHLDALAQLTERRPELFAVSAELDLRARRDPEMAAVLARHEQGWRKLLTGLIERGRWAVPVDAAQAAELVIATVKGVRLDPALAGPVLSQLGALLTDTEEERA
jgi:AcrR family transcriptional regulator